MAYTTAVYVAAYVYNAAACARIQQFMHLSQQLIMYKYMLHQLMHIHSKVLWIFKKMENSSQISMLADISSH